MTKIKRLMRMVKVAVENEDVEVKYHEAAEQIKYMIELIKNHHPAKIKNGRRTTCR